MEKLILFGTSQILVCWGQSSQGEDEVLWEWVEQVYNVLRDLGAIERRDVQKGEHRVTGGYRSAFIFGLLARFSHIASQRKPRSKLVYHTPDDAIRLDVVGFLSTDFSPPDIKKQEIWTEQEIIDQFQAIRTWRKGNKTALHKPLLLLHALARCKRGDPRLSTYSRVDKDLSQLLIQFYSRSQQQRTEYPFWRLQNDGLWEILGAERLPNFEGSENPKKKDLLRANVAGGFPQPLYDALHASPDLTEKLIKMLLDRYFPQNVHQAVREAVGLVTLDEPVLQEPDKLVVWTEEKIIAQFRNRAFEPLGNFAKVVPGEFSSNKQYQPFLTGSENGVEIVDGSQIARYEIVISKKSNRLYLDQSKYLISHKKNKKIYDHQKSRVVYQRFVPQKNSQRLIATILPAELFCSYSVGYLTDVQVFKLGFLVALLNSNLLNWKFGLSSINNTVNGYEIEALRIPVIDFTNFNSSSDDYEARLGINLEELINDGIDVANWVQGQISDIQDPSVAIHDLLDLCAREIIGLHGEKQREVREFVTWLEQHTGFQIDNRSAKIIIGDYYNLGWSEFERVLRRDAVAIEQVSGVNVRSSESRYRIKQEYERSVLIITPLLERIQVIDSLINQLVYKLYGLTEKEIAIVEGSE